MNSLPRGEKLGRTEHSLLGPTVDLSHPHLEGEGICLWDFSFLLFHTGSVLAGEKLCYRQREHWHQHTDFSSCMTTELYEVQ